MRDEDAPKRLDETKLGFERPRKPQTVLLSSHEQAAVNVGLITISAAELDRWLTQLIAMLINPDHPPYGLVAGRMINDKLNMLRTVLPVNWEKGGEFIAAIRRVTEERNAVAHAVVEWDDQAFAAMVQGEDPIDLDALPLVFRRENKQGPTRVDEDRLYATQLNLVLLNMVALALWSDTLAVHAGGTSEVAPDLPRWVLGWGVNPHYSGWPDEPRWEDDVRRLFQLS